MPIREVTIRLKADASGLRAGVAQAVASIKGFERELEKSAQKRQALNELGSTFGRIGFAAAAGVGIAVKQFADFDSAMANVRASLPKTDQSFGKLREAAMKAGAATKFSATEAADGVAELAKAGVSSADILKGGLDAALNLAAADGLAVADAASIVATSLNQFGLRGDQATRAANLLAGAAYSAQGNVTDMATALKYIGPVAHSMGISIEDTTAAITELASQGILADQAGTGIRGMLLSLTSPSKVATDLMTKYKISLYDAQGAFIGLGPALESVKQGLADANDHERDFALGQIFGNQQITAAKILYEGGAKGLDKWSRSIANQNTVAEIAHIKMNTLAGDWENFKGSLQTALIGSGSGANSPLRGVLRDLKAVVDAFTELPTPIQGATIKAPALTAALGGGVFVFARTSTAVATLNANMVKLGLISEITTRRMMFARLGAAGLGIGLLSLSGGLKQSNEGLGALSEIAGATATGFAVGGPIGAAIGDGAALLHLLWSESHKAAQAQKELAREAKAAAETIVDQNGALVDNARYQQTKRLQKRHAFSDSATLGVDPALTVNAALGSQASQAKLQAQTDSYIKRLQAAQLGAAAAMNRGGPGAKLIEGSPANKAAADFDVLSQGIERARAAQARLLGTTGQYGAGVRDMARANKEAINVAYASVGAFGSVGRTLGIARGDAAGYVKVAEKVPKDIVTEVTTKGFQTSAGTVKRLAALYGSTPKEVSTGLLANDLASGKVKDVTGRVATLRNGKKVVIPLDADPVAAKKIAAAQKALDAIKQKKRPTLDVDPTKGLASTKKLQSAIDTWYRKNQNRTVDIWEVTHQFTTSSRTPFKPKTQARGGAIRRAAGGPAWFDEWGGDVAGPGTETSDSIPAMLSNGEHVLTASDVRKAGGQDAIYRLRAGIQDGTYRFASGGSTSTSSGPSAKQQKLQEQKDSAKSDLKSIKDALLELKGEVQLFQSEGDTSPWISTSAGASFAARARLKVEQFKTLARRLYQLRQLGLTSSLLSEVASLGSQAGVAAADELLANRAEIGQLNQAYASIQQAQQFIGALSYQAPKPSDDKIHISLKDFNFDPKTLHAGITVIAENSAGKVLAKEKWDSLTKSGV